MKSNIFVTFLNLSEAISENCGQFFSFGSQFRNISPIHLNRIQSTINLIRQISRSSIIFEVGI